MYANHPVWGREANFVLPLPFSQLAGQPLHSPSWPRRSLPLSQQFPSRLLSGLHRIRQPPTQPPPAAQVVPSNHRPQPESNKLVGKHTWKGRGGERNEGRGTLSTSSRHFMMTRPAASSEGGVGGSSLISVVNRLWQRKGGGRAWLVRREGAERSRRSGETREICFP